MNFKKGSPVELIKKKFTLNLTIFSLTLQQNGEETGFLDICRTNDYIFPNIKDR